jgi:hypothetical protein
LTAIAGLIDGANVWMGGDSAGVSGYSLTVRKDPKVFTIDEFIIGYTSSFRMGQLLRFYLKPDSPKENQNKYEYMVCSFIPKVRQVLRDNGYLKMENNKEIAGTFLVGWRGCLYIIHNDLQVGEAALPYVTCGCGQDVALGSLHATESSKPTLSPKDRIHTALQAAEQFSAGVRSPFTILTTTAQNA